MDSANPGDIVALASGGPDMTVMYVVSSGGELTAALCWFTAVGEYRTGELPLRILVPRPRMNAASIPHGTPSVLWAPPPDRETAYSYTITPGVRRPVDAVPAAVTARHRRK